MTDFLDLPEPGTLLDGYIFPPTGMPLNSAGTAVSWDSRADATPTLRIETGFPLGFSGADLAAGVIRHVAEKGMQINVEFSTSIAQHALAGGQKPLQGVRNIIAVASGKGGVGKSTVAFNLAQAAAREGARVGLLDADIYGPSVPLLTGLGAGRPESADGRTMQPLEAHGLQVMSIGFLVDAAQPVAWRGPMATSALNQLLTQTNWQDLDYLFVDMPPGTGDIQLTLAQRVPVTAAVIVTTPQDLALADARKALEMFRKVNIPVLGVVENMSVHICAHCGHEEAIFGESGGAQLGEDYAVPLLGQLPLERVLRVVSDTGHSLLEASPDGPVAAAIRSMALRVMGELAATGRDYSHLFPKITVE